MIKILTDSTSYIPIEFAKENDIKVIPLRVLFDDEEFEEGAPGSFDDFFEKFTRTKIFPKTSQPSLQMFIDEYNKIIDEGNEAIVFTISYTISGTFSVANLAKSQCKLPEKITVIDSKSCCQVGSLLQLKPILSFKEGVLGCAKKTLGIAKAIQDIISMIPQNIKRLFIIHIANTKFFDMLKKQLEGKFENIPTYEGEIGPVVASHIGPAIGVAWIC